MKRLRSTVAVVLALAGLAACGQEAPKSTAGDNSSAGFPVTVTHLFGTTTIASKPQRVVAIGGGDMEAAISLGVVPVAGADWFGHTATRGWVKAARGDKPAPKLVQSYEPKFEEIAALKPDLILYVNSINDKKEFETFNAIAPTIAAPAGTKNVYGVKWQDQVAEIAKATGTTTEGSEVIKQTEALLADAAKANPEFAGKTITAGVYSNQVLNAWLPSDPRMHLLTSLGFKTNPQLDAMENGDFYVAIPAEQTGKADADVIYVAALDAAGKIDPGLAKNKLYNALPAVKSKHVAYFGGAPVINTPSPSGEFSSAFSIGGPLGIKFILPELVAQLKKAVAGQG